MNVTQLRAWIRKYGNLGVIMAAFYLTFRSLSRTRKATVISVFGLSCAAVFLLHTLIFRHAQKLAPASLPPLITQDVVPPIVNAPATTEGASDDGYTHVATVTVGADKWKFMTEWIPWEQRHGDESMEQLIVSKNERIVLRTKASDLSGAGLAVKRMNFPFREQIIAVEALPGMGHPTAHHFYMIRKGKLIHSGKVGAEFGGPVFIDKDGDGHSEWMFDDYCWYEHFQRGTQTLPNLQNDSRRQTEIVETPAQSETPAS